MKPPRSFGHFLERLWSAFSQMVNVVFLLGHPNESVSGRSHREGWWIEKWIDRLFFWQEAHCRQSYLSDLRWATEYLNQHRDRG